MIETTMIGNQLWMTNNLDVDRFQNGDLIPHAVTTEQWIWAGDSGIPAWCYFNNDASLKWKYGRLYNWHAVADSREISPMGYSIPTKKHWQTLFDEFGGELEAGFALKSVEDWIMGAGGSNESGFNALPSGSRDYSGNFHTPDASCGFWSKSQTENQKAFALSMHIINYRQVLSGTFEMRNGFSIRCIKD